MGPILLLLVLGLSIFIAVPVFTAMVRERKRVEERSAVQPTVPVNLIDNDSGVIVSEGRGHLVFVNDKARHWFGMNGDDPNLETLAEAVKPSSLFIELFGKEGQASFRIGERRIEASSHIIPMADSQKLVVVMREFGANGATGLAHDPEKVMHAIAAITHAISDHQRLEAALTAVLESISPIIAYDTAEINLWEPDLRILRPLGRSGPAADPYYVRFEATDGVYHTDDSYSGWLVRYRQPLLIADVRARPDVRPKITPSSFQSYLGIPLMLSDRLIGTLELASQNRAAFNHEDLALLQSIAGQVAIAIENAHLNRTQAERAAELSGLQQIAQTMGAFSDPRTMYTQLVSRISGLMNSEIVGILLFDEAQRALIGQVPFQNVPDSVVALFRIETNENSAVWPLWTRRSWWFTNEARTDELVSGMGLLSLVEALGIRRMLLIPMEIGQRRTGLIMVANKRDNLGYTDDDMRLMAVFAAQTGIVVESARLYNEQARVQQQPAGLDQIEDVLGILADQSALIGQITERVAGLMSVRMAGVLLYSKDEAKLLGQEPFYGIDHNIIPYYEVDTPTGSAADKLYRSAEPWAINDLSADSATRPAGVDTLARMTDIRQTMFAALRILDNAGSVDEQLGVIQVSNKLNNQPFDQTDREQLAALAAQAAQLLVKSRNYRNMERRAREAEGLRRISEITSSTGPLSTTLRRIAEATAQLLECSGSGIALLDAPSGKIALRPEHTYGLPTLQESFTVDIYAPGHENTVAVSRRPFYTNDIANDGRVLPIYRAFAERFGIFNSAQVPIIIREQGIGELSVINRYRDFSRDDIKLLQAVAALIADAVERARLYEATDADLRARIEELDALARVSNELNTTIELDRILEAIRVEAQRTMRADSATVVVLKDREEWPALDRPQIALRIGQNPAGKPGLHPIELRAVLEDRIHKGAISPSEAEPQEKTDVGQRWSVGVPIHYGADTRGVIHITATVPPDGDQPFDERVTNFIAALANQAAVAIANDVRYQQQIERNTLLQQRAEQIAQIFELGRLLRTETDLDTILDAVANAVADSVGFRVVVINLVDQEQKLVLPVAQAGVPLSEFEDMQSHPNALSSIEALLNPKFGISASFFLPAERGAEWNTGEVYFTGADVEGIPKLEGSVAWNPDDLLLVPMRDSTGRLNGVMSVDEPRSGRRPNRSTIEALEIFANQAAFAIENFRLLEAYRSEARSTKIERDRLAQLHTVASEVQRAPDIPTRLQIIADGIREQGWKRVAITLRDSNLEPRELITAGYTPEQVGRLRSILLPGIVWRQRLSDPDFRKYRVGQAYYLRHSDQWVTENKLSLATTDSGGVTLSTPAPVGGDGAGWHPADTVYLPIYGLDQSRVIGIISMDSPADNQPPTEPTMRPIELFAVQAAAAVENTRLIEERTRAAEQESRLNAVMEAVSNTLDISEIITSLASGLYQLAPYDMMTVGIARATDDIFDITTFAVSGQEPVVQSAYAQPIGTSALSRAFLEQAGRVYPLSPQMAGAVSAEDLNTYPDLKGWQQAGAVTVLLVPLVVGGRSVGALQLGTQDPTSGLSVANLPVVQRLANLAAVSVENARLFQQAIDRERFSAALGRVGQAVNAVIDLPTVLDRVCAEARALLEADSALIWTVQADQLVGAAGQGVGADQIKAFATPLSDSTHLGAAVLAERGATFFNDLRTDDRNRPLVPGLNASAALIVPLLREEEPVGAFALAATQAGRLFTTEDLEKASAFGVQAAIAIERAALEANLQDRAEELTALTEISTELAATLQTETVAQIIVSQVGRILEFDTSTLWLQRGSKLVVRASRGYANPAELLGVEVDIADSALFREITSQARQVLNIPDTSLDSRFVASAERKTRSWLGVALNIKGALLGLLVIERGQPNAYGPTQEQLAVAFANQASIALENARLFEQRDQAAQENTRLYQETQRRATELNQQAQRLALLNRVSASLAQSLDIENAFEVTLTELVGALGLDRGTAIMIDPVTREGRIAAELPRTDMSSGDRTLPMTGTPIFEQAKKALNPVAVFNASDDPLVAPWRSHLMARGVLSTLVVPLVVGGQVIGAVNLYSTQEYHLFQPNEIELAQTIASQAAVAVQNANLFEQSSVRTRELEMLFEATQATTSTLDLEQVIANAANQMVAALSVDACTILLLDDIERRLVVRADLQAVPAPRGLHRVGAAQSLADYPRRDEAILTRQAVTLTRQDADLDPAEDRLFTMRSMAARLLIPMIVRDQPIGLVTVEIADPARSFDSALVRLSRALTNQAAIAVDNARLQTETSNKLQELFVINELSIDLAASIEVAQIFSVLQDKLPKLAEAQYYLLAIYDLDADQVAYPVAVRDGQPTTVAPHPIGTDEVSLILKRRVPLLLVGDDMEGLLRSFGITHTITEARSFLGVPLLAGEAIVGVLAIADQQRMRAFTLDDQRVLTTVASQVAIAIQNARLFERTRRFATELEGRVADATNELRTERDRLNVLYRITTGLTASLDMDQVLSRALEMMAGAVGGDMGAILGIDSLSDDLIYRAAYDREGRHTGDELVHSQHEGLVGWVIQAQQSIVVGDVQADGRWVRRGPTDDEPRAAIVALLEANEDILGVVLLYSRQPNVFNEDHLRLVTAAAGQVATAMNNADLYGLIREQAERLGAMVRREQVEATKNAAIVESIADGVMVANPTGEIIQFNSAAERILGLQKGQTIGREIGNLAGLYAGGGGQRWLEALRSWMADPTSHRPGDAFQEQLSLPDGKIVSVLLSPVNMGDQFLGTVSVFRDITREIEVDRMKSDFVATVSHELRTPMTSIKGYADLLLMGAAGHISDQQQRFLGTIKTNADRLSQLVNELLDISRIDRGVVKLNLQPTNVAELVETSMNHIRGRAQNENKQLQIESFVPDDLPLINADFDKIVQIVNNLLDNSFNYTPPGGSVTLAVENEDDKSVLICVADTGVGIAKEIQPRVFERFFRGEDNPLVMETSGTGLGLSIVKEYVTMHNGEIWLESEPGQGTTFYVRLPAIVSETISP